MAKGVLALNTDGFITRCVAPPDKRGVGRCNHAYHQDSEESSEEFIIRVEELMKSPIEEEELTDEEKIIKMVQDNALSFNRDPNWNDKVAPLISRYLRIGDRICEGELLQEETYNSEGDRINKLKLNIDFEGQNYEVDFGEVPFVNEDGTIEISGVKYRCLPVVSRNKVGYGQGYGRDGNKTTWIYQESGDLAIVIPTDGDKCTIFGKKYLKSEIEEAVINREHKEDRITMLVNSIDKRAYDRLEGFGKEGWMESLSENFKRDEINDLEWRRVYTYEDQVMKELDNQLRRMGVTFRKGIKKDEKPVFYQKNNTENIRTNLLGRSNVQFAENLNPLAAYSQSHKITLVGLEGYNKDNCPEDLRLPGDSYKGISDPLDQSSGKGIGLNIFLKDADIVNGTIKKIEGRNDLSLTDFVPYKTHNKPNRVSMATSLLRQSMTLPRGENPRVLGDIKSDKAWKNIAGSKMGVNLKVAYLTGEKEWEDSATISQTAAEKMRAVKSFRFPEDKKYDDGDFVAEGTMIGGKVTKHSGYLKKKKKGFDMEVEVPFRPGDKISGRYGNKCTIGEILPDDQMPKVWNHDTKSYEPSEIIMSPLSIGKRGNIGAILETQNNSLLSKDIIPVRLPNGKTVKANNGKQFIMRIDQVSAEKRSAYADEQSSSKKFGSRFGEMESILMTTTEKRRTVLNYLKNQKGSADGDRLDSIMKAIGVDIIK